MPVVPYTFANQSGQIPLSELDVNFANVKAFADTAGNVTGNVQANITGLGTLTNLSVSGNITATNVTSNVTGNVTGSVIGNVTGNVVGNVTGNVTGSLSAPGSNTQVMFNDNGIIGGFGGMTFTKTTSTLVVAGNIISANLSVTGTSTLTGVATAATAANGTSNTQIATTAFVQNSLTGTLPSGVIVMWSGSIVSIPSGWALCNGANGTPDLRDRFVVGAGNTYSVAATGGSANAVVVSHTHTATSNVSDPGHNHSYTSPSGSDTAGITGSSVVDSTVSANTGSSTTGITVSTTISSAGSSGTNANLPPYYALAYIMKL